MRASESPSGSTRAGKLFPQLVHGRLSFTKPVPFMFAEGQLEQPGSLYFVLHCVLRLTCQGYEIYKHSEENQPQVQEALLERQASEKARLRPS